MRFRALLLLAIAAGVHAGNNIKFIIRTIFFIIKKKQENKYKQIYQ